MSAGFVALGVVQGALAAVNALGLVLVWRATRVLNLAQPAIGLVGGVLTGMLVASAGWSFWWAAPVGIATSVFLGYAAERLVMTRLAKAPRVVSIVATIGLAQLFGAAQTGIPFALGGRLPSYDVDLGVEWFVFPVLLKGAHLLAIAVVPVVLAGTWYFVHRSRIGTAAVAAGQDLERAGSLGVDTSFVRSTVWAVAGGLSGIAGVLSVPVLGFALGDGVAPTVLLLALAPAVLARFRNLTATVALSLVVGVVYQVALANTLTAGAADVILALAVIVAIGAGRLEPVRLAAAARAASWVAAVTPQRVPRALQRSPRWRSLCGTAGCVTIAAAALPPAWLPPASDVRFATSAALAIGAVSCAVAWTFAGELALGQWGVAACAAAAAFIIPGPPVVGAVVGVVVGAGLGLVLAELGRRQSGVATAMAGVALSVGAPYALLRLGAPSWNLDIDLVAPAAGVAAASVAVAGAWLRGRRLGIAMVAARDERRRAAGFGVDPVAARRIAMAMSGATAGLAGVIYLASVPAGVAPDAFAAPRSLDVVAFAVVGGLGSTVGAALGGAALIWASLVLPSPWGAVASGAGVLWVVLLMPAGLTAILTQLRDAAVRVLTRQERAVVELPQEEVIASVGERPVERAAVVAGADTREAVATPTVRAAAVMAGLLSAPALASFFGTPGLLRDHLGVDVGGAGAWALLMIAGVAAVAAWTGSRPPAHPPVVATVVGLMTAGTFVATGDATMVACLAVVSPIVAAWAVAQLVATSRRVVVPEVRPAAAGVIVACALGGALGSVHLAAVAAGGSVLDAARWAVVYAAGGAAAGLTASRHIGADTVRVRARLGDDTRRRGLGRLRWAPLRVDDLVVDFGTSRVLDGAELDVPPGTVVALVGANGSGKSTLLRTVAGFIEQTHGRVAVAGHDISGLRPNERANLGVAFVDGARPIFPDLTVRENLRVGAYLTHRTRRAFDAAVAHVLAVVPVLSTRLDTPAGALSGGEQRHLAVAQTLFRRPAVLLADELTLGLDRASQRAVHGLLRTLADDGMAIVVVDHDLEAVLSIADQVAVVDGGAVVASASAEEFTSTTSRALEARFLTATAR